MFKFKQIWEGFYTLSHRSLRQERVDKYQQRYAEPVKKWESLKKAGVPDEIAQACSSIERPNPDGVLKSS